MTLDEMRKSELYDVNTIDASSRIMSYDYISTELKRKLSLISIDKRRKVLVIKNYNYITTFARLELDEIVNDNDVILIKYHDIVKDNMSIKPISPKDITAEKLQVMPDKVIKIFNDFIASNWNGHNSTFKKDKILNVLCTELDLPRENVYDKHYLDVEDIFRKEGWNVVYEQPCRGESFDAYFKFTKP